MGDKEGTKSGVSPLGQYFARDDGVNNIFDQITNGSAMMTSVVESASTQDLFRTACEYMAAGTAPRESQEEAPVCKIFAARESAKTETFFDSIAPEGPFPSSLRGFEELSDSLHGAESDRSREAWIPREATRRALIIAASPPGGYTPTKEGDPPLTTPSVVFEEDMVDNVAQLVKHHFGEVEASHRKIPTADDVCQDERGICDLIRADCLRAALNLTRRLLAPYGQKVTPHSVQLWFTRLSLLVKLGAYQIAEEEGAAWWHPDRPDLYYQFYPKLYGARPGTMLPFQMRLLLATLPAYVKKYPRALDRLYSVLAVVRRILKNLDSGKSEDGSLLELTPKERELSKRVWSSREARVSQSIVNVALMAKDFPLAIEMLRGLIDSNNSLNQKRALESALGRVLLQVGDVRSAERCFETSRALKGGARPDVRELVDRGLFLVAHNNFRDAYDAFKKASTLEPSNIMVLNNMAVCLLYLGQLKNALTLLTTVLHNEPARTLTEPLLINVCTLFELESSRSDQNKQSLLRQVAKYKGDAINVACLKLHV